MPPFCKGYFQSQQFLLESGISGLCLVHNLGKVGYRLESLSMVLQEDSSYCAVFPGSICPYLCGLEGVIDDQTGSLTQGLLQSLKSPNLVFIEGYWGLLFEIYAILILEGGRFQDISQGFSQCGAILYESPVEVAYPQK